MSQNWEADKMLDVYIHDYMLKRKMHASAKAFMTEGKVATDPVAIDAPGGFLLEWWSVFWDIFIARTNEKHSESAATYIETQQIKAKEHQQKMQMQQLHLMQQRNAHLQRRDSSHHPPLGATVNADVMMMGKPPASSTLGLKMQEELMKSATNQQGLLIPGSSQNVSSTLQQIQGRPEIKQEVNLGDSQKPLTTDPSSFYKQAILQSKSGLGGVGFNQGVTSFPLKGWPLTGIDNLRPGMGMQVQKPNMQNQNQFYLASQQQQPSYGLVGLPRGSQSQSQSQSMKDGQPTRNDGPVGSPGQMNSPKINMAQMQQSTSQQQDQLQQQSNRKRKQHSSCGPTNSTGTGNTPGPDGVVSSTNQVDDIEQFGDDSVESFLQQEGGDGREVYGAMKQQTVTQHKAESSKGFSFTEVGCIQTRKKVLCCHFSSDGKLLASAGHDKKAVIWNMDTLQTETTPEEHQFLITDIRFRPNSTKFGTTSLDQSVRIWDASNPSYCLHAHTGHTSHIMSLDFHPNKSDLFCFSDSKNEIHYWNMNPFQCTRVSKGGSAQVRFQPRSGQLLASASNKVVSIFDVETATQTHSLQAHTGTVNYICWDINGEYLASVSDDTVRVWSVASGECIHELNASDNQFYSCIFHPSYSALLVIGGMRSLELWNMAENKTMSVLAHDDIIAALAHSPVTGMVASSSHDTSIKLWN